MPLTVSAAASTVGKSSSRVATAGGSGVSRTAMRVAMPSVPSLPTNTPRRSSPAGSGSRPPSTVTDAVGQHDLERQDVGAGDARRPGSAGRPSCWPRCRRSCTPAGSTGRGRSAGRAGRAARVRSRLIDPGLDPGDPVVGVDRQDAVHLRGDDHDRVADRHGPAGQAGARAPGHERPPVAAGDAHGGRPPRRSTAGSRPPRPRRPAPRRRGRTGPARRRRSRTRSGASAAARSATRAARSSAGSALTWAVCRPGRRSSVRAARFPGGSVAGCGPGRRTSTAGNRWARRRRPRPSWRGDRAWSRWSRWRTSTRPGTRACSPCGRPSTR